MYKVYVWTNMVNGKRYVGATSRSMEARAGRDGEGYRGSPRFYNAIKKHGFSKFRYEILGYGLTKSAAAEMERAYISRFDTMNPNEGYNLQEGGFPEDPDHIDVDRRKRISDTLKRERSSESYRKVMSDRMHKVWDDPDSRSTMLRKRKGKQAGGRKPIAVFCDETGCVYGNLHEAALAVGVHYGTLATMLKSHGDVIKVGTKKRGHKVYTLRRVNNVHIKESGLLEASAGNAGGNQQPSLQMDRTPAAGRFND